MESVGTVVADHQRPLSPAAIDSLGGRRPMGESWNSRSVPEDQIASSVPVSARSRAGVREGVVFALALAVAATSGVATKRAGFGPAFAAVEPVAVDPIVPASEPVEQILPMIAASIEEAVVKKPAPVVAEDPEVAPLPEGVIGVSEPAAGHARYFNGRPIRPARTIMMTVTAYSPDAKSCGDSADGITASLKSVWTNGMHMAAADTRILPFGTLISVPGYAEGDVVPVLDRGGAIKGHRLDMLYPTHEIALQWGVRRVPVVVWEYADTPAR